jgi:hypothetical protein
MSVGMAETAGLDTAREATVWYGLTAEEASVQLGVDPARGLETAEVERRRAAFGPNKLAEAKKEPELLDRHTADDAPVAVAAGA